MAKPSKPFTTAISEEDRLAFIAAKQQRDMMNYIGQQSMVNSNPILAGKPFTTTISYEALMHAHVKDTTIGRFEVRKVENGFILRFSAEEGSKWSEWIAVDIDQLAAQFVQILVESKLDCK